jgi:hypothetical protein
MNCRLKTMHWVEKASIGFTIPELPGCSIIILLHLYNAAQCTVVQYFSPSDVDSITFKIQLKEDGVIYGDSKLTFTLLL